MLSTNNCIFNWDGRGIGRNYVGFGFVKVKCKIELFVPTKKNIARVF